MILYTLQLAQWRKAKAQGIVVLDVTTRTGDRVFAPGWDLIRASKADEITPEEYNRQYRQRMIQSFRDQPFHWGRIIQGPPVALACYCSPDGFCHRYALAGFFQEICRNRKIECEYRGELR